MNPDIERPHKENGARISAPVAGSIKGLAKVIKGFWHGFLQAMFPTMRSPDARDRF